jgi:hypothetical protein
MKGEHHRDDYLTKNIMIVYIYTYMYKMYMYYMATIGAYVFAMLKTLQDHCVTNKDGSKSMDPNTLLTIHVYKCREIHSIITYMI